MILGTAAAWVVPEILVSDWASDNRTDWVRFNTVMRFWLDGYALIPLFGAIVLAPHVLADRIRARRTLVGLTGLLLISVLSLIPLLRDRFQRTPESASTNGAAFLKVEHPTDWMIIDYLSRVAGPVVLGEVCGTGSTPLNPYHYGMPGRLSAFSGRPSVCGWGRHTWMFQQRFSFGPHAGENIWSSFLAYEQALETVYRGTDPAALTGALRYLQSRSITHLAFGELERQLYGDQDLELLAKRLGAAVVFSPSPHAGVIRLSQVSTELAGLSDPLKPPAPWGPPDQHLTRQVAIHRRVH
jgi:uncharacterized membrane protein